MPKLDTFVNGSLLTAARLNKIVPEVPTTSAAHYEAATLPIVTASTANLSGPPTIARQGLSVNLHGAVTVKTVNWLAGGWRQVCVVPASMRRTVATHGVGYLDTGTAFVAVVVNPDGGVHIRSYAYGINHAVNAVALFSLGWMVAS
ncbi:MAG: hypothetical protein QM621_14845 [Aeromicrobium sp.]|uniref:hypothetical protein n=1 Tax=Aeromicrobium sp. TaxID=1871063 RepID=UPI0039E53BA6